MKSYSIHLIIVLLLVIFICFDNEKHIREYFNTKKVMSEVDNRSYNVINSFTDSQEAANKLSETHKFMIEVMRVLKKKFIIDKKGTYEEANFVKRVLKNYRPDMLFENDPLPGDETSFVVNKGSKFGMCLRKKSSGGSDGEIHDDNTLRFVAMHELTHLGTLTYGHNDEFWSWFQFILKQAHLAGLYKPIDYSRNPINYCGLPVRSNPYFG